MKTQISAFFLVGAFTLHAATPTFTETIAAILYQNCVECHRPGAGAPFSLITYEDAAKRGSLIATVTKSGYMPPWHAVHGYGEFEGERKLTPDQIAAVEAWVKAGMPRGDASKMPVLPQFRDGWKLGTPDLVLEMPAAFDVPATGPDVYRNFAIPTGLAEDRWVRAIEFRPGANRALHHALFAYVPHGKYAAKESADGRPGFAGSMAVGFTPGGKDSDGIGGWAVGGSPEVFPDGMAQILPKGSDVLLQLHFHPTGKVESDRSTIGIYFAKDKPTKMGTPIGLPALFGFGAGINIPPGEANFTVRDMFTLPGDVLVHSVLAHAHYLAREMKLTATLPDGATRPLIWIDNWDFNWQESYSYKSPVELPKGTRIDVTLRYDNSADNPRNPSNPPKRVLWGEETFDEMGTVSLFAEILKPDEAPAIQAALSAMTKAAIQHGAADGTVKRYLEHQRQSGTTKP
jgi:hypothetical protein